MILCNRNHSSEPPVLLMGVGIADKTRDRREHHTEDFVFPSLKGLKILKLFRIQHD